MASSRPINQHQTSSAPRGNAWGPPSSNEGISKASLGAGAGLRRLRPRSRINCAATITSPALPSTSTMMDARRGQSQAAIMAARMASPMKRVKMSAGRNLMDASFTGRARPAGP